MVCFSWFRPRSSIQVQAWPVHQTRPNRGVGLRRLGPWDSKTVSSREVSRDSRRLRHWTLDGAADVLLIEVDRRLPQVASPASFTKQIADRHSRPLHSRSPLPVVVSPASFTKQIADSARSGSVSLPADSPPPSRSSPASKPTGSSLQFHVLL